MMDVQLNAWSLFAHAQRHFAQTEIVTRLPDGTQHRYCYEEMAQRAQQLMHALDELGVEPGDRVASLAWNGYRHLEAYFGVPCARRVLHTLNLRLSPEDLAYVINHAEDRVILVDPDQLPLLEQVAGDIPTVRHVVVLGAEVPETTVPGVISYEDLLAGQPTSYRPLDIPEGEPMGLCYTSGTTGRPKGAVYTHRSTWLHATAVASHAGMAFGPTDSVLAQVPMFHANAWGMPYAATAVGAKQVFYGGALDARAFAELMVAEDVTVAAGVPTVWLAVGDELARRAAEGGGDPVLPALRHIVCGGSQPSRALIERYLDDFAIPIVQAWGMTETSPLASLAWPQQRMRSWSSERVIETARVQAGLPLPGLDVCIRDDHGQDVAWDGQTMGDLYARGPWVIDGYFRGEGADCFSDDGWFRTGDVAIGSPDGYFVIADRTKDLIKSGGEWISSVDMEAAIMALPEVVEAAVVAVPDPKWEERPLVCVVPVPGAEPTAQELVEFLEGRVARWWLPERWAFLKEIPKTSVGKFDKKVLRAMHASGELDVVTVALP
jgi:fatty-acyl-CoA synthase